MVGFSDFPPGKLKLLSTDDILSPDNNIKAVPPAPLFSQIVSFTSPFGFPPGQIDLNNTAGAVNQAAIIVLGVPKDKNWWLIHGRAYMFSTPTANSRGKFGPWTIDGQIVQAQTTPISNSLNNGLYMVFFGNDQVIASMDYVNPVNLDPNYAVRIRDSLTFYAEVDGAAGEQASLELLFWVWESLKTTPPEPVITTVPAQSVNESWQ